MNAERGRPRSFDPEIALDRATEVFWRHGFRGASLAELTEATGLSKPSLYAAFGDKEALFLRCLQRYAQRYVAFQTALLDEETDTRRAVEGFLRAIVALQGDPKLPGGCMVVTGSADCGTAIPAAVDAALRSAAGSTEQRLLQRLQKDGHANARQLATLFSTVLTGTAVMAKSGQSLDKLQAAVDAAMLAWPAQTQRIKR